VTLWKGRGGASALRACTCSSSHHRLPRPCLRSMAHSFTMGGETSSSPPPPPRSHWLIHVEEDGPRSGYRSRPGSLRLAHRKLEGPRGAGEMAARRRGRCSSRSQGRIDGPGDPAGQGRMICAQARCPPHQSGLLPRHPGLTARRPRSPLLHARSIGLLDPHRA
jgi:hypothetical protein